MSVHDRVTEALRQVADGVDIPEVDPDAVRAEARSTRRRSAALLVAAAALALGLVAGPQLMGRDTSAPPVGPQPTSESGLTDREKSLRDMRQGAPPVSPFWRDGFLHVTGAQIETPFDVGTIAAAGDAVIVGEQGEQGPAQRWALVRGDRVEVLPAVTDTGVGLSPDGRIAFWASNPTPGRTRFVAWDTTTNRELAARDVPAPGAAAQGGGVQPRAYLNGIDNEGVGYWYDEASAVQVTEWDVRSDQIQPRPDLTEADLPEGGWFWRDPSVSPDGSKQATRVTTAAGSSSCCTTDLQVGPIGGDSPRDAVSMQLPPSLGVLTDDEPDGPLLDVWWDTETSILVQTHNIDSSGSYLLRCQASDGACERVFSLGEGEDSLRRWSFARYPIGR